MIEKEQNNMDKMILFMIIDIVLMINNINII